jgi:hypothetical protein
LNFKTVFTFCVFFYSIVNLLSSFAGASGFAPRSFFLSPPESGELRAEWKANEMQLKRRICLVPWLDFSAENKKFVFLPPAVLGKGVSSSTIMEAAAHGLNNRHTTTDLRRNCCAASRQIRRHSYNEFYTTIAAADRAISSSHLRFRGGKTANCDCSSRRMTQALHSPAATFISHPADLTVCEGTSFVPQKARLYLAQPHFPSYFIAIQFSAAVAFPLALPNHLNPLLCIFITAILFFYYLCPAIMRCLLALFGALHRCNLIERENNSAISARTNHFASFKWRPPAATAMLLSFISWSIASAQICEDLSNGLGQARHSLAAAALPSGLVFFAGGFSSGAADVVPALQSSLRACVARRCCDGCWSAD